MNQHSKYSRKWQPTDGSLSRRHFLSSCAVCTLGMLLGPAAIEGLGATAQSGAKPAADLLPRSGWKDALFWEAIDSNRIRCTTCPNYCVREEGGVSLCRTRINSGGKMYTMTYGKPCYIEVDPLAKNPLYHVTPGLDAIGVATAGCNLTCKYCQNFEISQVGPEKTKNVDLSPAELITRVQRRKLKWITFSYTEVTAFFEYALDIAKLAKDNGIHVAVCSAGYICEKPLLKLLEYADAFSVTLKGYSPDFYKNVCGGNLDDTWRSINTIAQSGKWMEIVTLIVPGMNDADDGIKSLAASVAKVGTGIPLHFPRFAPYYKLQNLQQTPVQTLDRARSTALKEGLKYVYLSLSGHEAANTYCPGCRKIVIERASFKILKNNIKNGLCGSCSYRIPGLWTV